jgi:hypothetical protein
MPMSNFTLLEPVFRFFASSPMGLLQLSGLSEEEAEPMRGAYDQQLELIPQPEVETALSNESFRFFNEHIGSADLYRRAAEWVLARYLESEIPRRRLRVLADNKVERPSPYDHPALADLRISSDKLVSVREFDYEEGVFARNGYAFSMAPAVESPNAAYWLLQSAASTDAFPDMWIRLDPFLWGRWDEFQPMSYRMLVYGVPLNWERIKGLKEDDHGRWQPGRLSSSAAFTDYVWSPRGSEVHFQCEELPHQANTATRGTRYLHAVYSVPRESITHLDGAIRILSESQWADRHSKHVRHAGKVGHRVKLFRLDIPASTDLLSELAPQFFVGNNDVARYFGAPIPAQL